MVPADESPPSPPWVTFSRRLFNVSSWLPSSVKRLRATSLRPTVRSTRRRTVAAALSVALIWFW